MTDEEPLTLQMVLPPGWQGPSGFHRVLGGDNRRASLTCGFGSGPREHRDHVVPDYHVVYVLAGRGRYTDWNGRRYEVSAGSVMQRLPGRRHSSVGGLDGHWVECYVCVPRLIYGDMVALGVITPEPPVLHPGMDSQLLALFQGLLAGLRDVESAEAPGLLVDALQILRRITSLARRAQQPHSLHAAMIADAQHLLHQGCGGHDALRQLAARHSVSYERFRKVFKDSTGISPGEYRIRRRIEKACEMLRAPDVSTKQIALDLGFPDVQSFTRQFRQRMGSPPVHFRKTF